MKKLLLGLGIFVGSLIVISITIVSLLTTLYVILQYDPWRWWYLYYLIPTVIFWSWAIGEYFFDENETK